jgi:hypothetical protein
VSEELREQKDYLLIYRYIEISKFDINVNFFLLFPIAKNGAIEH